MEKRASNITFLSSLGAALEYYDFMIYGLLVPFLTPLFFSSSDPSADLAKGFSVFALGYLARPLGGLMFGLMADRKGRRRAFTSAMFLMAFATLLMGLLPTATSVGAIAAWLLVACRLLQGLSFGAELPGAITVVSEYNEDSAKGLQCGFVISSTSVGAILATMVLALVTGTIPPSLMGEWGWRLPFLLGGLLAVVSWRLRSSMEDTPLFKAIHLQQRAKGIFSPLMDVFKNHSVSATLGIGIILFPAALIITNIYFASSLVSLYRYESQTVYQGMTLALIAAALMVPLMGWLGDRWGRLSVIILASLGFVAAGPFLFGMLDAKTSGALATFLILWQVFISASIASAFPLLAPLFPTAVRFTAVSFCYNLAYVLSALLPNVYTHLGESYANPLMVYYCLAAVAGLSLVSALHLKAKGYR